MHILLCFMFLFCADRSCCGSFYFLFFPPGCLVVYNWFLSLRVFDVVKSDISKKAINFAQLLSIDVKYSLLLQGCQNRIPLSGNDSDPRRCYKG